MSTSRSTPSCLTLPPRGSLRPSGAPLADEGDFEIVGSSAAMKRLRLQVRRIGPHFRTVLVSGEAGTGKELAARRLHAMSLGASEPFIACQAAAFESILVEYAGDAGSADIVDILGHLMKTSHQGTLFLDAINEMSLEGQDRLLSALKKHELTQGRLEASQRIEQRMELRMIASASEDLRILVSTGRFRQDLYQLLATVNIALPPLRERMEDLPELARYFLDRFAMHDLRSVREIRDEAMERMRRYCWPGNVRELESVLRNAVLQSEGAVLEPHHLPVFSETSRMQESGPGTDRSARLQDVVEQHVRRVLKDCRGNKLRAAEVLGISRSTLYRMLNAAPIGNARVSGMSIWGSEG